MKIKNGLKLIALITLISFVLSFFLFLKSFSILHIQGDSMYPTYSNGDVILMRKESELSNGDISIFHPNSSWNNTHRSVYIKRVIASENDVMTVNNKTLMINDIAIEGVVLDECDSRNEKVVELEEGHFLMIGDNYPFSNDSLSQYCSGNDDFLIQEKEIITGGNKIFKMKGASN